MRSIWIWKRINDYPLLCEIHLRESHGDIEINEYGLKYGGVLIYQGFDEVTYEID